VISPAGRHASGIVLVLVSACAFGAMAILARGVFAAGGNVPGLLLARFAIAGAILAVVMVALRRRWPRGRPLLVAVGMGAIGYAGQAACFFSALHYASAGLVALLLYVYPTLVVILSAIFLGERLTAARVALLVLGFAGLALMLGGGSGTATGVALGLGAAAIYSVYILVGARELARTDALASTTVICLAAAATFAIAWPITGPKFPGTWWGWTALAALAVVGSVVAILAFFEGLKRVGPSTASVVSTFEPVFTAALAWIVLGEGLAAAQLAGGAMVLASAAMLAGTRRRASIDA
jgi:drug/metabolite transporter (DMT)-like permease